MAGVAEMLCQEDDQVLQLDQLDSMGFAEHYEVTKRYEVLQKLISDAEGMERLFNKIVIHDYHEFKDRFPKDKVILYFHGSKLRKMPEIELEQVRQYPCFVTTPDLLDILPHATYLPAPVDLELFAHFTSTEDNDEWLCMNRSYQQEEIEPLIKAKYPKVEYLVRSTKTLIQYEDMPDFLSQYDNYVDWKFTYDKPIPKTVPHPSCTGIQALAVGCKVYDHNGTVLNRNLLVIHDKKRISKRFREEIGRTT